MRMSDAGGRASEGALGDRGPDDSIPRRARVALFAKAARAGTVKTRLVPPLLPEQAAALSAAFAADTAAVIETVDAADRSIWLPAGEATPDPLRPGWSRRDQGAGDLGERLAGALDTLGADGSRAIVLGADHPDLPADRVRQLIGAVERHPLVFGPAHDGGFYGIGASGLTAMQLRELLSGIEWSTPHTLADVLSRGRLLGLRSRVVEPWYDVDTPDDLRGLCGRLRRRPHAAPASRRVLEEIGWLDSRD